MVLEKTLESPLDFKEIKPANPKGNQPWILTGRTDAEAEAPILWLPDVKSWLTGKDPDAGEDWAGGEGDERGWDGWMASLTQWTWIWANSRRLWRTEEPGCCSLWGHKRVGHSKLNNELSLIQWFREDYAGKFLVQYFKTYFIYFFGWVRS